MNWRTIKPKNIHGRYVNGGEVSKRFEDSETRSESMFYEDREPKDSNVTG